MIDRQQWLEKAKNEMVIILRKCDIDVPDVYVGFAPLNGRKYGLHYHAECSLSGINEIFIDTEKRDEIDLLGTLAHELIHASSNGSEKHGKLFKEKANRIGLEGKMRSTVVGDKFKEIFADLIKEVGELPYKMMKYRQLCFKFTAEKSKPLSCPKCDYQMSVKEYSYERAVPFCPCCDEEMEKRKRKKSN